MSEKFSLKDHLFNKVKVEKITGEISHVYPSFKKQTFSKEVLEKFPELELKARISWIVTCLEKYLPAQYPLAIAVLVKALPPPNNPDLSDDDFGDFIYAPYAEFVAKNGCTKEFLKLSLDALYQMTQRFSAEDAIRYFINAFPEQTLDALQRWSKDSHYHVRRLCSEGTRPKLPWSQKIHLPLTAPLAILDNLFYDTTRYVTRSVANHLNDISKLEADLVIDRLKQWRKSSKQKSSEMDFITSHALRTLVKQGHPEALRMLGFSYPAQVSITNFHVPGRVKMDSELEFSFKIKAQKDSNILIDYIIHFQNKSGQMNSKKIFKLTKLNLKRNEDKEVSKRHILKRQQTTRTLYPGKHQVEIQINGQKIAKKSFNLK